MSSFIELLCVVLEAKNRLKQIYLQMAYSQKSFYFRKLQHKLTITEVLRKSILFSFAVFSVLTKTNVTHTVKVLLKQPLGRILKTLHTVNHNSSQCSLYRHHITALHLICCLESVPGYQVHYPLSLTQLFSSP